MEDSSELCEHFTDNNICYSVAGKKIFRDQCLQCYDDTKSLNGLDVCLKCFGGFCRNELFNHSQKHITNNNHCLMMNIKQKKIETAPENSGPKVITKLAIGKEGGADFETEKYEQIIEITCFKCNKKINYEKSTKLKDLVTSILNAACESDKEGIKAWEEELFPCEHTLTLVQNEGVKIPEKMLAKCNDCELSSNLWLCLTCGNLACGRKETGGHQHAIEHYNKTKHPLVVKTGTITPNGEASLYCYACDNDIKDENLPSHLINLGIDITTQKKTDKTVTEMNLDININLTLSKTIEDGKVLTPLYGEGHTGLENLGNSCYMNSVLQILFSLESFKKQYYDKALDHLNTCLRFPPDCFLCQMSKIMYGLHSGMYSQKKTRKLLNTTENAENKEEIEEYQDGIRPSSFKLFFGQGNADFSSNKQQDAREYLEYLLEKIKKLDNTGFNPFENFQYDLEVRMECESCQGVKYKIQRQWFLLLNIPDWKNKKEEDSKVSMQELIDAFLADEIVELECPSCKKKTNWKKTQRVLNYPKYFIIVFNRIVYDWVPIKLQSAFEPIMDNFDATLLSKPHKKENEQIIDTALEQAQEEEEEREIEFSQESINFILQCGVPELGAKWGLYLNNNDVDMALGWYCENSENPDYQKPLPKIKVKKGKGNNGDNLAGVNMNSVESLVSMGFPKNQAIAALKKAKNNIDQALDLIYSGENLEDNEVKEEKKEEDNKKINEGNGNKYNIYAYITHLGKNFDHGHYVCHIRQEGKKWNYFNDSKVALWDEPPVTKGFIYFYKNQQSA